MSALVVFLYLISGTVAAVDCSDAATVAHLNEQLTEINRRVHTVHMQLTDLRLSTNLMVTALLAGTVGILALLAYLWRRTGRAEGDIQVLRRVRMITRR